MGNVLQRALLEQGRNGEKNNEEADDRENQEAMSADEVHTEVTKRLKLEKVARPNKINNELIKTRNEEKYI